MRYIVEYKLHNGAIPYFISDGGYWPVNNKLIGITIDDSESYIPKFTTEGGDLASLSNQDLINKVVSINLSDPRTEQEYTIEEKTNIAEQWLKEKGF